MPGTIFLVTGLPYTGQKTLLNELRTKLTGSPTFDIIEPTITHEDFRTHESQILISEDEFKAGAEGGKFLTWWKYEGSAGYLVADVEAALERKMKVIFRCPRDKLPEVEKKAASLQSSPTIQIVDINAPYETCVERAMVEDDKFNDKAFAKRIKSIPDAKGETVVKVENTGTIAEGLDAMLTAIAFDPLTDLPPSTDAEGGLDLATCSCQDYLKAVLFPHLQPAMERINIERPADPVEFLALYLKKSASTTRERVKQLTELKTVKTRLREELSNEFTVVGRV
jgi:ribose 1,5-bisphosphokinase PhnN